MAKQVFPEGPLPGRIRRRFYKGAMRVIWWRYYDDDMAIETIREKTDALTGISMSRIRHRYPDVNITSVAIGAATCEWICPDDCVPGQAMLYLHGGGYFMGSAYAYRLYAARMARYFRMPVLLADYRLAPEHPYPAALDDAIAALHWLQGRDDVTQVFVGGDSAGGGLTLATLLRARDEGMPTPTAAFCLSPWTDLALTGRSLRRNSRRDTMFNRRMIRRFAPYYPGGNDTRDPYISPLYGDYTDLPPLLVLVGREEVLLDDSLRLETRIPEGGLELEVWHGVPHVWPVVLPGISESRRAMGRIRKFLREKAKAGARPDYGASTRFQGQAGSPTT